MTAWVVRQLADFSLVADISHILASFFTWSTPLAEKLNPTVADQRHIQTGLDDTLVVVRALVEESDLGLLPFVRPLSQKLREEWFSSMRGPFQISPILCEARELTLADLILPPEQKLRYPAHARYTVDNVERMRRSEDLLKSVWEQIDDLFRTTISTAGHCSNCFTRMGPSERHQDNPSIHRERKTLGTGSRCQ